MATPTKQCFVLASRTRPQVAGLVRSAEQRLASELDYMVFRRILTPVQVRAHTPSSSFPSFTARAGSRVWSSALPPAAT